MYGRAFRRSHFTPEARSIGPVTPYESAVAFGSTPILTVRSSISGFFVSSDSYSSMRLGMIFRMLRTAASNSAGTSRHRPPGRM